MVKYVEVQLLSEGGFSLSWIISAEQLQSERETEEIMIIDVRSNLTNPDAGRATYEQSHIPGAYYLHLTEDLSGKVEKHGGNHPLPNVRTFAEKLSEFGVTENTKVVIYDEKNDMFASRAWWLLRYVGVRQTFVLNGGFTAWQEVGYEVTADTPKKKQSKFTPTVANDVTVTMEEVRDRNPHQTVLIDSRAYERYLGNTEPLYKKAGHIPGAVHSFWQDVLDEQGNWKSAEQLKERFSHLKEAEEIIVSCGSGISACPNILALQMAGFDNVKLYPGSFSDWISYEENDIATKEE